jgi:UDP-glucose 4-epimerase
VNILVTGGAGFIGSHVARKYLEAGHRVVVLDNLSTGTRARVPSGALLVEADLNACDLAELLVRHAIEFVNHHAAHIDLRESVREPVHDAEVNVVGSLRLAEACRKAGVRRLLFASTGGAIYGDPDRGRADESHPTRPISPYGCAKLAVEKYLDYYRAVHGLEVLVLRYANVYGPGQDGRGEAGVVAIFLARMREGRAPTIHGDGLQTRDYVYVGDCAEANLRSLDRPGSGVWNVGTGVETSVRDLFRMIARLAGFGGQPLYDAAPSGEQRRSVLDGRKLLRDFGMTSYTSLDRGLERTAEAHEA